MFAELLRDRVGSVIELSNAQVAQLEKHFDLRRKVYQVIKKARLYGGAAILLGAFLIQSSRPHRYELLACLQNL